jgi:hypothetical protein
LLAAVLSVATLAWADGFLGGLLDVWGPLYTYNGWAGNPPPDRQYQHVPGDAASALRYWNKVMLDANALDHTPPAPGESRVFGEQLGPHRTSRAFAIVHIAILDAVSAISGMYQTYTGIEPAPWDASLEAAIAQAAHDTLVQMYPSQAPHFDDLLVQDLQLLPDDPTKSEGVDTGQRAAAAIVAQRTGDGSEQPEPRLGVDFFTSNQPGKWRQDPISMNPLALGAYWGLVRPFVMSWSAQFRSATPPALNSVAYTTAYNEVKTVGGDGVTTPSVRLPDQTIAAIFWGYDGTPGLGTPPRMLNQIAVQIAGQMGSDVFELARLLGVLNVALADGAIACWESKFYYQYWRPIAGIRESDPGTGPTGAGDGNLLTLGDPRFMPLGAPASNLQGPNFTPPFPSYPSGHATFAGAMFQTLRHVYGTDSISFTFVSDEFNGMTRDNQGRIRPRLSRSFSSLSQAEEEDGQSRIYLGIHWSFDKTEGIRQGRRIADYVFTNVWPPR